MNSCSKPVSLCALLAILSVAGSASSQEIDVDFAGNQQSSDEVHDPGFSCLLTFTSDYVWRGVSQTHRNPAIQPEIDFDLSIDENTAFYGGAWGSNIKYPGYPDANVELEYWTGLSHAYDAGITGAIEALYYHYPGETALSYGEVSVLLSKRLDLPLETEVSVLESWSWNTYGTGTDSFYTDVTLKVYLPDNMEAALHYGYSRFAQEIADRNYSDWKLTLIKQFQDFELELGYTDSTASQYGHDAAGHLVFSLAYHL